MEQHEAGVRTVHLFCQQWRRGKMRDADMDRMSGKKRPCRSRLRYQDELCYRTGSEPFSIDASKVRLTLFALAARREGLEAAPRRSRPIVCRLVRLLPSCSHCDTPPPGRVAVPDC